MYLEYTKRKNYQKKLFGLPPALLKATVPVGTPGILGIKKNFFFTYNSEANSKF